MARVIGWVLCVFGIWRFLSIDAFIAGIQGGDIMSSGSSTLGALWSVLDIVILDKIIGIAAAICGFIGEDGKVVVIGILLTVLSFLPIGDYIMGIMYALGSAFAG